MTCVTALKQLLVKPVIAGLMGAVAVAEGSDGLTRGLHARTNAPSQPVLTNPLGAGGISRVPFTMGSSFNPVKAGALLITSGREGDAAIVFSRGSNSYVFTPSDGLMFTDPTVTSDGRRAFFLVRRYSGHGHDGELSEISLQFYGLARFEIPGTSNLLSTMKCEFFLREKDLAKVLGGKRGWVSAIRGASADGSRLLLELRTGVEIGSLHAIEYAPRMCWYDLGSHRFTDSHGEQQD